MFRVSCLCGRHFAVKASSAGTSIRCDGCSNELLVPALSVLRSHEERGEPAPAVQTVQDLPSPAEEQLPDRFVSHFFGDVSSQGSVSPSAMENHVGVVLEKVGEFFEQYEAPSGFEIIVSCALLPNDHRVIEVETNPPDQADPCRQPLTELLRGIAAPPIHDHAVAYFVYLRVNRESATKTELRPFRSIADRIEKWGADQAFRVAAGLHRWSDDERKWGTRLRKQLRKFFLSEGETAASPQQTHAAMEAWLENTERVFADTPISEIDQLLVKSPEGVGLHVALATRHMRDQDWATAAKCYGDAIRLSPEFALLYGRRGVAFQFSGNSEAALADFNRAIELAPFDPQYFSQRAQIFSDLEAWSRADEDLSTAHGLAPNDPAMLLFRAAIRMEMDEYAAGMADLKESIRLDPNSGQAHAQLGWIYQETAHYDIQLATDHLTDAVDLLSDNVPTLIRRSLAYASQNKFELAHEDCDRVIRLHPDSASAFGVRGRVLQMQGEYDAAIDACTRAIDLGLDTAMVFLSRGIAYAATERPELATSDCEAALALEPDNALAFHLRGTLCMEEGEFDAAMESFNKARRLAPDWNEPREHLALLHRIKENPQAAVDEQSHLVSQQPKNPSHYVNRAFALAQLGDYEKARRDYDRAIELDGENEDIYYYRGLFFMQRQEYELALQDLNHVLSIADDYDDARLQRATVLLHLRRQDDALDDYAKLIAKYPDDPSAYTGRAYAFELIGREQAAEKDSQKLMDIVPEHSVQVNVNTLSAKVHRLRNEEQYEEAIVVSDEIIAIAPEESIGYRLRGGLQWDLEQFVEAYDDFTKVLGIDPQEREVLSARGQVQAEMGEWRAALDDLDLADELSRKAGANKTLAFTLSGKALALAGLDRIDESGRDYEESVKLCPTNPWVYYHRGMMFFQRGDHAKAKSLLQRSLDLTEPALPARKKKRAKNVVDRCSGDAAGRP